VNAAGASGGWSQLGRQAVLAVAGIVYPFLATLLVLWITDHLVGLRLTATEEDIGLDVSQFSAGSSDPHVDAVRAQPAPPEIIAISAEEDE
jgi:ammonia channel protein AmtB